MKRRTNRRITAVLLTLMIAVLAVGLPAPSAQAQEIAIIQATATVLSSMSAVGTHNLQFGTVTPGVNKTVDKASAAFAGAWTITGLAGAEVSLTFDLPAELQHNSLASTIPLVFSATDASYDDETGGGQSAPTGVINPSAPPLLHLGAGGTLQIWIGGMAMPGVSQTSGDYSADVRLTIAYTGG